MVSLCLDAVELIEQTGVYAHPYMIASSAARRDIPQLCGERVDLLVKTEERLSQLTAQTETSATEVWKRTFRYSLSCTIGGADTFLSRG
jgi:hypothetical protein